MADGVSAFAYWRALKNKVTTYAERLQVSRVARTVYVTFRNKWYGLLADLQTDPSPVMLNYMSDGWSAFMWQVNKTQCGRRSITTWTRERQEFVLQRGILKVAKVRGIVGAMLFEAPRPLLHGRSAWNMLTAFEEFMPPLRSFTTGPCVTFAVFDGLQKAPLRRMILAKNELRYERETITSGVEMDGTFLQENIPTLMNALTDFVFIIHCIMHVFNLALKWGVAGTCSTEIQENLHIAIRSCNQSTWALHDQFDIFVLTRAVPMAALPDQATLDARAATWRLVLRDPDLLDILEESLAWWDPVLQLLYVRAEYFAKANFRLEMCALLKRLEIFCDFADTRFSGTRDSTCSWFGALLCGLDYVVGLVRNDPRHTMEYLSGHSKGVDPATRYHAAVLCATSLVTDKAQRTLLEDDRFLKNSAGILEDMWDEVDYVWKVAPLVWESLIAVIGGPYTAARLRHDVLVACLRTHAKSDLSAFRQLRQYPLKLTQGDIASNVDALQRHTVSDITDTVALQFQEALDLGWSPSKAERTLELVSDASCTVTLVEQGHGVSAQNLDAHQFGNTYSLQSRSMIHQARGTFGTTEESKAKAKIDNKIEHFNNVRGKRFEGKDYLASINATRAVAGVDAPADRLALARAAIGTREARYQALGPLGKVAVERQAAAEKRKRQAAIDGELEHLHAKRTLLDIRLAQEKQPRSGIRTQVSSFTLSDDDRDVFNAQFERIEQDYNMELLKNQFPGSPKPPPPAHRTLIENSAQGRTAKEKLPPMLAKMCRYRDAFNNVFLFEGDGSVPDTCYMVALLVQKPYQVVWHRMERVTPQHGATFVYRDALFEASMRRPRPPAFRFTKEFLVDTEVHFENPDDVWVWGDFQFTEESMVVRIIGGDPIPFAAFYPHEGAAERAEAGDRARRPPLPPGLEAALLEEFPWLTPEDLGKVRPGRGHGGRRGPGLGGEDGDPPDVEEEVEDEHVPPPPDDHAVDVRALAQHLMHLREVWAHDEEQHLFFYVHNRGGEWLMLHKKEGSDSATCYAREPAKAFCRAYRWPQQRGFGYKKHGGVANANRLAREVARLGHWYCCTWHANECLEDFEFAEDHQAPDDFDFVDWATTLAIDSAVFEAVIAVRAMKPVKAAES